jgi:hypothetical protein
VNIGLKNPAELVGRIGVDPASTLLLIDVPESLERLLAETRDPERPLEAVTESRLRSVKEEFDAVILWREDRVGSEALLAAAAKRLRPTGKIWVVTAMRKVIGPRTPAAHRLDRQDVEKAFAKSGLRMEGEARFSAWHAGYRFSRG